MVPIEHVDVFSAVFSVQLSKGGCPCAENLLVMLAAKATKRREPEREERKLTGNRIIFFMKYSVETLFHPQISS